MSNGAWLFVGGVIGYAMAAFTYSDEAKFWKGRADYWHENSTAWMNSAFRCLQKMKP